MKTKSILIVSHGEAIDVMCSNSKYSKNRKALKEELRKIFPLSKNIDKEKYFLIEDPFYVNKISKLMLKNRDAEAFSTISEVVRYASQEVEANRPG